MRISQVSAPMPGTEKEKVPEEPAELLRWARLEENGGWLPSDTVFLLVSLVLKGITAKS